MIKRIILLIFVFCFLLSYAVCAEDKVKIFYNGKEINADVNAFIENSRTLIPVVMLTKMGYETSWNEKKQTVKIFKNEDSDGKNITLTIGSNIAVVDSKTVLMDVKAKIYNDRTYVPIRFVSENFGYNVSWENLTRSVYIVDDENLSEDYSMVTNVAVSRETGSLSIKLYADSEFSKVDNFSLSEPLRYVFDIHDAVLDIPQGTKNISSDIISSVRYSQYTTFPKVIRLVIDAKQKADITYKYVDSVFTILIKDEQPAIIENITATKINNGVSFSVSTNRDLGYTTYKLSNPTRYYIEFEKAKIEADDILYSSDIISKVKTAENDNSTQIIFYLKGTATQTKCEFYRKNGNYCVDITKRDINVQKSNKLIVIDPGHGGDEPGSLGKIDDKIVLYEKDVNLKIAMVAYNKLINEGYNVIATRTDDSTVSLMQRVEIANESNAALFVSVHNNSFEDSSAKGTLTMYAYDDEKDDDSMTGYKLANTIQPFILEATGGQDRGLLKNPKIYVLAKTTMPAALVECLFVSNEEDLKKLMNEKLIEEMGIAIANGIKMAVEQLE